MFTGIVTDVGELAEVVSDNVVKRLVILSRYEAGTIDIGASIACDGVCLTVVSRAPRADGRTEIAFDAGPETLAVTTVDGWHPGCRINLERALKIGDELGGHLVSGHVDGLATVVAREDIGETTRFTFRTAPELARFVAVKGSVCLNGTSLTVNTVDGNDFSVLLIPHTLAVTNWDETAASDRINLEVDQMARYVARLQEAAAAA